VGMDRFLMVLIVVENVLKNFSVTQYIIVVAIIMVFLSLPFVVIAKEKMDKKK
jgi:hypothetical protein